jgi:hypothetical protein
VTPKRFSDPSAAITKKTICRPETRIPRLYTFWKSALRLSRFFAGKINRRLCGNPLATLTSAGLEHLAAALGAHADPETVGLFALSVVGLKRSFHLPSLSPSIGRVTIS